MKSVQDTRSKTRKLKFAFLFTSAAVILVILGIIFQKNYHSVEVMKDKKYSEKKNFLEDFSVTIKSPTFEGTSTELIPYKVSAKNISKTTDNIYVLDFVKGIYSMQNGNVTITSDHGSFDEESKFLTLKDNVKIIYNDILFSCKKIKFDVNNTEAQSDSPVKVYFKKSTIESDLLKIEKSGNKLKFEGNVESNLDI